MKDIIKKLRSIFSSSERIKLTILILLLFIGMILEIFGLGAIIPVISILIDPEYIEKSEIIKNIRYYLPEISNELFVFISLFLLVFLYIFKTLYVVFLTHKQNRFLANLSASLSNKLFDNYMSQPYSFHISKNSSELIKNIQVEIACFFSFLGSLVIFFTEIGYGLSVIITLIFVEPLGAISISFFFGLLSLFFLKFTKNKLKLWGISRGNFESELSKKVFEGLSGIKDLIVYGKTKFYTNEFSKINFMKARVMANQTTLSQIPRFYLELVSIIGLVCFILLLLYQGKDVKSLFTTLGIFVAGTFRLIPSLNRIIGSTQSIKFYLPSIDIIYHELKNFPNITRNFNDSKDIFFENKIEFKNIEFSFSKNNKILKDVNLIIKKGEKIGIIGETGSGKSTLIDLLIGIQTPTNGDILIDGLNQKLFNKSWRKKIGYVSQTIYLIDDTIKNNIAIGINEDRIDDSKINKVLKLTNLKNFINTLEFGVNTIVGERGVKLSGGQRQRICLARALYNDPEILVLDEATSALDFNTEEDVIKSINNLPNKKTIIMIAHRVATLKSCDKIFELKKGKLKLHKTIEKHEGI